MSESGHTEDDHSHDTPLILDELSERLEQFRLLTENDDAAADEILAELGGSGRVELEMVKELAAPRPISHPERLMEAHAVAMRSLEVLSRNGARPPSQLQAGPFTPVARFLAQQVIRYIVRQHQVHVADSIRDLYSRRLGWTPADNPVRLTLVRARLDLERASSAYKKSAGGLPTFLVGGAAVSSLPQLARAAASSAVGSRAGVIVAVLASFLLLAGVSWVILRGAAIARRRIRLTMDRPLGALWETVGWCGRPPKDSARAFATIAIVITVLGWLLIPLGAFLLFTIF